MMIDLYHYSLLSIFLVGLAVVLVAGEIGWQLGMRAEGRGGESIATLEAAVLGLLALIIGFTFAMALARFEARRDAVVNEANAIGTTALRARLLPEPQRTETLKLLRDYVQVRLDLARSSLSLTESPAAVDRSNALQEAIWQQAKAVAARDNAMVPTGLFIQTLNEMIDSQGKRLAALRNRIPNSVLLSLFRHRRRRQRVRRLRQRTRNAAHPAAGLPPGAGGLRRPGADPRSRPADRGFHQGQPAADDRYGRQHRWFL